MRTYLAGPFLSLLPETWRAKLPWAESIRWRPAAFISGVLEALTSLCALVVWYSYSVTHHTPIQIEQALRAYPNIHPNEMMMGLLGFVYHLRRLRPGEIIRASENYEPEAVLVECKERSLLVSICRSLKR